jgi:hypothetical protein
MNALVLWTELGRGLSGTLVQKGADEGLLGEVILRWCREHGGAEIDAERWFYRLEPTARLTRDGIAAALGRLEDVIARATAELAHESTEDETSKQVFLTVVNGWFAVGPALIGSLPRARAGATEDERASALAAWCARFLPKNAEKARDLGVRVVRE